MKPQKAHFLKIHITSLMTALIDQSHHDCFLNFTYQLLHVFLFNSSLYPLSYMKRKIRLNSCAFESRTFCKLVQKVFRSFDSFQLLYKNVYMYKEKLWVKPAFFVNKTRWFFKQAILSFFIFFFIVNEKEF